MKAMSVHRVLCETVDLSANPSQGKGTSSLCQALSFLTFTQHARQHSEAVLLDLPNAATL